MGELCGTECLECHYHNNLLFSYPLCLCDEGIRTSLLITWAAVQSASLKSEEGSLLLKEPFLIFAFVMLLRETIIIYHCYYCHLKHERERIELGCQRVMGKEVVKGLLWFLIDLHKEEGKCRETRVCFNISGEFKNKKNI